MVAHDEYAAALGQVLETAVLINDDMNDGLARVGLTPARAHLLWELRQRGPSTQQALAVALGVSPRNVTGLVDALDATGFVTRETHPTDRRATLVSFTSQGAAAARELEKGRDEFATRLFSAMPQREFDGLVVGLEALLARLRELVTPARTDRS